MTVACARCHDHKFDPIPTKDYYALAGIFLSTEPLYGTIKQKYSNTPTDLLPIGPDAMALHTAAEEHEKKIQEAEKPLAAKREELNKATEAEKQATEKKAETEKRLAANAETLRRMTPSRPMPEERGVRRNWTRQSRSLKEASARVAALKDEIAEAGSEVGRSEKEPPATTSLRDECP